MDIIAFMCKSVISCKNSFGHWVFMKVVASLCLNRMSVSDAIKEWLKFKNSWGVSCVYNMLSKQRLSPFDLIAGERLFSLQISVFVGSKNFVVLLTFVIRFLPKKNYFIFFLFYKKKIVLHLTCCKTLCYTKDQNKFLLCAKCSCCTNAPDINVRHA